MKKEIALQKWFDMYKLNPVTFYNSLRAKNQTAKNNSTMTSLIAKIGGGLADFLKFEIEDGIDEEEIKVGTRFKLRYYVDPSLATSLPVSVDYGGVLQYYSLGKDKISSYVYVIPFNLGESTVTLKYTGGTDKVVTFTVVSELTTLPVITVQPTNVSVADGADATFAVTATGATSYQWQVSEDAGTTWEDVVGATSASYTKTVATANDGDEYRVLVTNAKGSVTSTEVTLTVA